LVAALSALAVIGAIYQAVTTKIDQRTFSPPGEMVDVGDHSLHINCTGQGSPTVILEAANLGISAHWVRVQQQVAQTTRVCAYDRAGMGWSESGPQPRDAKQVTGELHTLLKDADTEGAYVLVAPTTGLVDVLIDAQSTIGTHDLGMEDEWGWSESWTNQNNYLMMNVLHPNVSEPSLSLMSNFYAEFDFMQSSMVTTQVRTGKT
jgi:hypothetical protein